MKDKNFLPKLTDSVFGWTVRNDLLEGLDKGVRDVPAFFMNNTRFTEAPTLKNFTRAIDEIIENFPSKLRA